MADGVQRSSLALPNFSEGDSCVGAYGIRPSYGTDTAIQGGCNPPLHVASSEMEPDVSPSPSSKASASSSPDVPSLIRPADRDGSPGDSRSLTFYAPPAVADKPLPWRLRHFQSSLYVSQQFVSPSLNPPDTAFHDEGWFSRTGLGLSLDFKPQPNLAVGVGTTFFIPNSLVAREVTNSAYTIIPIIGAQRLVDVNATYRFKVADAPLVLGAHASLSTSGLRLSSACLEGGAQVVYTLPRYDFRPFSKSEKLLDLIKNFNPIPQAHVGLEAGTTCVRLGDRVSQHGVFGLSLNMTALGPRGATLGLFGLPLGLFNWRAGDLGVFQGGSQ